MLRPRPI